MKEQLHKCDEPGCKELSGFTTERGLKRHIFAMHTPEGRKVVKNAGKKSAVKRLGSKIFRKKNVITRVQRNGDAVEQMNELTGSMPMMIKHCPECGCGLVAVNMARVAEIQNEMAAHNL